MEVKDLKLEAIHFTHAPTKSQIVNSIRSINTFLADCGAALMLDGSYAMGDEPLGILFNALVQLRAAADKFDGGPNAAGLSVPQMQPRMVPQR